MPDADAAADAAADEAMVAALREELRRELVRVEGRLRAMPLDRLEPGPADLALAAAQALADLAADAQGRTRRPVPRLEVHGVADQVAVTAHDVLVEGDAASLGQAIDVLVSLRRAVS